MLSTTAPEGVDLQFQASQLSAPVLGSPEQIHQVLMNLIQNAFASLETTPEFRRRLRIQTQQARDGGVEMVVIDTGCGIDPALQEQIFEPFFTTRD